MDIDQQVVANLHIPELQKETFLLVTKVINAVMSEYNTLQMSLGSHVLFIMKLWSCVDISSNLPTT